MNKRARKFDWVAVCVYIICCILSPAGFSESQALEKETKEQKQTRRRIEWQSRQKPKSGFPKKWANGEDDSIWRYRGAVSLVKIIARPESYHKKFVATVGFLRRSRNPYLFLNDVEGKHFLFHNALFVRFKDNVRLEGVDKIEELDNRYVYVEGVFDQWDRDPNVCPNGTITISRIIQH